MAKRPIPPAAPGFELERVQEGTQATTDVLSVLGAAIEDTIPFKASGLLSLHNMQAGDEFLVIEEIRDQDDATYREYARYTYSDVQVSPMIHFNGRHRPYELGCRHRRQGVHPQRGHALHR